VNNEAPELSPEARRIISEARGFDDPTPEDRARVKTRWLASVAALAGVSSLTEAARAAGGIGWGVKAVGAAFALVAGAIGLYVALPSDSGREPHAAQAPTWKGETHERFEKTGSEKARSGAREVSPNDWGSESSGEEVSGIAISKPVPPVAPTPRPELLSERPQPPFGGELSAPPGEAPVARVDAARPSAPAAAPGTPAAPSLRERSVPARAVAARAVSTKAAPVPIKKAVAEESAPSVSSEARPAEPGPSGQLSEELALLSQIRSSVQAGSPNRALELLASYEARFGRPIMGMEADALRVDALCRAGQRDAARASAQAFQIEWPGSPLGPRVNAACP
jgi:hypothetical protein